MIRRGWMTVGVAGGAVALFGAAAAAAGGFTFTTLAGAPGTVVNSKDGTGTEAQFDAPRGVAIDTAGNVYVGDATNNTLRKVTPAGVVTTLAGTAGSGAPTNGTGAAARFDEPRGIAIDSSGTLYVADYDNHLIRKITSADGTGTAASFRGPMGIAVSTSGVIYVADYGSHTVRAVAANGAVSTVAGALATPGTTDGAATTARFNYPSGLAVTATGTIIVADTDSDTIRSIAANSVVTTLAGLAGRTSTTDGAGSAAHVIRRITPDGVVTTYAGTPGSFGIDDGTGWNARFYSPFGVAVDSAGTVYVADSLNGTIRKIGLGGVVTTLAGAAGVRGSTDGTGTAARFGQPFGIAVDGNGTIFVSDASNSNVRKITAAGVVTTLAGTAGANGSADGTGTAARFTVPYAVAIDTAGTLFVVDHGNHTIRKVTSAGVVTTLAGTAGSEGNTDGSGAAARFRYPSGVAVDRSGNVFVADTDNHAIRQITSAGVVTTVGGGSTTGSTDGAGTAAKFFNPKGIAADR